MELKYRPYKIRLKHHDTFSARVIQRFNYNKYSRNERTVVRIQVNLSKLSNNKNAQAVTGDYYIL